MRMRSVTIVTILFEFVFERITETNNMAACIDGMFTRRVDRHNEAAAAKQFLHARGQIYKAVRVESRKD